LLNRTFIDLEAEFVFVPADEVLPVVEREEAISFDANGARDAHRNGRCSFEVIHGAGVSEDRDATPRSAGILAIADRFALLGLDDQRQLRLGLPADDEIYAWAQREVASGVARAAAPS
jgi:hypothetical protein